MSQAAVLLTGEIPEIESARRAGDSPAGTAQRGHSPAGRTVFAIQADAPKAFVHRVFFEGTAHVSVECGGRIERLRGKLFHQ